MNEAQIKNIIAHTIYIKASWCDITDQNLVTLLADRTAALYDNHSIYDYCGYHIICDIRFTADFPYKCHFISNLVRKFELTTHWAVLLTTKSEKLLFLQSMYKILQWTANSVAIFINLFLLIAVFFRNLGVL